MRNRRGGLVLPGAASLVVGVVLLVVPAVLALTGHVLNLVWTVLLWVGFGEIVIGSVLLALAMSATSPEPAQLGYGEDYDEPFDEAFDEPVNGAPTPE